MWSILASKKFICLGDILPGRVRKTNTLSIDRPKLNLFYESYNTLCSVEICKTIWKFHGEIEKGTRKMAILG